MVPARPLTPDRPAPNLPPGPATHLARRLEAPVRRHRQLALARLVLTFLCLVAYAGHFYPGALITGAAAFYAWTAR